MAREEEGRGWTRDAAGRRVRLLDPYPLWLRGCFEPIAEDTLNSIVSDLGVPNRGRKILLVWVCVLAATLVIAIGGVAASVIIEGRPALDDLISTLTNPAFVVGPIGGVIGAVLATRQHRLTRVRRVLLGHGHCPHCGYRIAGLPVEGDVVRCPECGGAWPEREAGVGLARHEVPDSRARAVAVLAGTVLLVTAVAATIVMMLG
ncbi:MAG: hypothetical protein IT431_14045 [Phycisphaerales bacterium]|nr:hypothetical protein [Phycisphaerales bacterium]